MRSVKNEVEHASWSSQEESEYDHHDERFKQACDQYDGVKRV